MGPDKWYKVVFVPVPLPDGCAVTLQECDPKPVKGPVGDKVHSLLRATPPEPTLGMIYAEVLALRAAFDNLTEHAPAVWANGTAPPPVHVPSAAQQRYCFPPTDWPTP